MISSHSLMNSLPKILNYNHIEYKLKWHPEKYRNTICIFYINSCDEFLFIPDTGVTFYIEAERHYATQFMVRLILANAPEVLGFLAYEDAELYVLAYNTLFQSEQFILNEIQKYNLTSPKPTDNTQRGFIETFCT